MTVSSLNVKNSYNGDNTTTSFSFTFPIHSAAELQVIERSSLGTETVKLYSSDGHEYELLITREVAEQEWQDMPLPHKKESNPEKITSIQTYQSLKKELSTTE